MNQVESGEKKVKTYLILTFDLTILQVSWIRKGDVVVLTHGTAVFTSDERVTVKQSYEIKSLDLLRPFCGPEFWGFSLLKI